MVAGADEKIRWPNAELPILHSQLAWPTRKHKQGSYSFNIFNAIAIGINITDIDENVALFRSDCRLTFRGIEPIPMACNGFYGDFHLNYGSPNWRHRRDDKNSPD
jgi:hypothetical protein